MWAAQVHPADRLPEGAEGGRLHQPGEATYSSSRANAGTSVGARRGRASQASPTPRSGRPRCCRPCPRPAPGRSAPAARAAGATRATPRAAGLAGRRPRPGRPGRAKRRAADGAWGPATPAAAGPAPPSGHARGPAGGGRPPSPGRTRPAAPAASSCSCPGAPCRPALSLSGSIASNPGQYQACGRRSGSATPVLGEVARDQPGLGVPGVKDAVEDRSAGSRLALDAHRGAVEQVVHAGGRVVVLGAAAGHDVPGALTGRPNSLSNS
jgi:hypothetical protein